ncbi:MAG: hypothetical protein LBC18_11255 [Opitutaceae bacterium]|nr:hypothetical protein [Opitutaceae bacterium]
MPSPASPSNGSPPRPPARKRAPPGAGLRTGDGAAPRTFEVAGADGKFHPAKAMIDGGGVLLAAPAVASPRRARYASFHF